MADTKITALSALTAADPANDVLPIVDVNDPFMAASGTTKKISINNILGASGTATLASATISGDLTVDTSTLYVSSSADKVGIGTTSLSNEKLTVAGNISANAWLGRSNISAPTGDCSIFRSADNTLGFGIASSTAMRLDSNGLGVGVSPSYNIHARGTTNGRIQVEGASGFGMVFIQGSSGNTAQLQLNSSGGTGRRFNLYSDPTGFFGISDETAVATRLTIDSSGNVISNVTGTAPTLSTNSQMVFNLTSNTNLRISVRGTDGTTRTANITLA